MQNKKELGDFKIIDIHCHVFPEKIAYRAADSIRVFYDFEEMDGDGTLATLEKQAEGLNVHKFIISSAATKFDKVRTANDFIISRVASDDKLYGFGTTHAGHKGHYDELLRCKEAGLLGVKIHPDIQGFDIDDPGMFDAYRAVSELHLPVLFHIGDKKHCFSKAEKLRRMMDKFPDMTVIAAHMGGYNALPEAYEYLVGTNVYFDISEWYTYMDTESFCKMVYDHGTDKLIYGCDYPLNSPMRAAKAFYGCPIPDEDKEKIFHINAEKLFGI